MTDERFCRLARFVERTVAAWEESPYGTPPASIGIEPEWAQAACMGEDMPAHFRRAMEEWGRRWTNAATGRGEVRLRAVPSA